jgi:hypothetical protein
VRRCVLPDGPSPAHAGLVAAGVFVSAARLDTAHWPAPDELETIFGRRGFFGYGWANRRQDEDSLIGWSAIPHQEIPAVQLDSMDDDRRARLFEVRRGWCASVEQIFEQSRPSFFFGNIYDIAPLSSWSRDAKTPSDRTRRRHEQAEQRPALSLPDGGAGDFRRVVSADLPGPAPGGTRSLAEAARPAQVPAIGP